jgi:putative ABC transport system permease protein
MIKNYFKTALRSLLKHKVFTLINIVGLAIGISAAMVIYLVVQYDFSFDKFQPGGDRIYRVVSAIAYQGEVSHNSGVPVPLHKAINSVTGIEQPAPFRLYSEDLRVTVPAPNTAPAIFKNQEQVIICDESYFKLFSYQWLAGSAAVAFKDPNRVVLTESRAKLYFPDLTPLQTMDKTVIYDDSLKLTVAGIVADIKENTDIKFHDFISLPTIDHLKLQPSGGDLDGGYDETSWGSTSSYNQLFIKLDPRSSAIQIQDQLNNLVKKNIGKSNSGETHSFILQPLNNLHFNSDYDNFGQRVANKAVLYSLLGVAAFLLMLGCINFINLTTAQSSQRAREIGVRKTIGGTRQQLISQFLTETFLLTLAATVISVGLSYGLLRTFSDFIPSGIKYQQMFTPGMLLFVLVLMVLVAVISGLYPAVVMSSYQPVQVLKGRAGATLNNNRSFNLRKTLTVTQFVIAQFFVIATLLVSKQIHYVLNKDLGFKKDAVLYIRTPSKSVSTNLKEVYFDKVKAIPQVAMVSMASDAPSSNNTHSTTFKYSSGKTVRETDVELKLADPNYINVYQLKLLAGRNLQAHDSTGAYVINQTYCKFLGFNMPQQAIGKMVDVDDKQVPIIGVVADFYQKSLQYAIKPAAICYVKSSRHMRTLNVALKPETGGSESWKTAISKMEAAWHEVYPEEDFEYRFVDESVARFYKNEQNIGKLLQWATGLSVLISCLGLLGLAIYTTSQRTKEIGVRKVMGASVSQIVALLSTDFVKLIVIAFVIAAPIAWYFLHQWLQNFAYHTTLNIWPFLVTIAATILVALLTMSMQTIKAALANPVKSLRSE